MVKFVDLGVLYFSLVLPRHAMWLAGGSEWILRSLGGMLHTAVTVTATYSRVISRW